MYDLLPVSCFVGGVLVSKWCTSTKMYDLLPVSWSRSDAPEIRCMIFFGVFVSKWCPSTEMYDLLTGVLEVVPPH